MTLGTRGEVEEIKKVQNQQGERASPANEEQQKRVAQAVENQDTLSAGSYSTDSTNAKELPSESIPEGVEVAIQALNDNDGAVYVGDSDSQDVRLAPGDSITLGVTNLDLVYIQTPTGGDGVGYIYEG